MSVPTNHQNSRSQTTNFQGQLVCPHCQNSFSLTWRRYWAAPWGNYRCPECREVSYLKANSFWGWLMLMLITILGGILLLISTAYIFNSLAIGTLFFIIGSFTIGFTTDKWISGHLGQLQMS
jgi:hypothetical protein